MTTLPIMSHERLLAWRASMQLLLLVYRLTRVLPAEERYGLTSQTKRAALSVPTNIAEGCARGLGRDRLRFLDYSIGSLAELRTLLCAAVMLEFMDRSEVEATNAQLQRTRRLLGGLRRSTVKRLRAKKEAPRG